MYLPFFHANGPADADEIPLVAGTLAEAAFRRPDGVEAALAPHREEEAGADGAEFLVLLRVAVRLGLDAAVERGLAQVAEADGGDVEVDRRGHVGADRHVHGQALERRVLADVPPVIHQMPGHRGVLLLVLGLVLAGSGSQGQDDEEDGEQRNSELFHERPPSICEAFLHLKAV